jgi:hypothetical protein
MRMQEAWADPSLKETSPQVSWSIESPETIVETEINETPSVTPIIPVRPMRVLDLAGGSIGMQPSCDGVLRGVVGHVEAAGMV